MANGAVGKKFLAEYSKRAKPLLNEFINNEIPKALEIGKVPELSIIKLRELLKGGKGIRGALVTLGYKLSGGTDSEAIDQASLFAELVHTALLIHDDFMDRDDTRRGVDTIHKHFKDVSKDLGVKIDPTHYGYAISVCVGDAAYYLSWKALMESNFPAELKVRASREYIKCIFRVTMGQELDMSIAGNQDASYEDILKVLTLKTGEYTCLMPLTIGSILAGETDMSVFDSYKKYSEYFGWAFQIQDDVLGIFGNEEKIGKPVGSDIREGKNTLFVSHLRSVGSSSQISYMDSILGNPDITKKDVEKMKKIFVDSGTYDFVIETGWKYVKKGCDIADNLSENKDMILVLKSLLHFMMERIE